MTAVVGDRRVGASLDVRTDAPVVIGLGDELHCDDAVGIAVVRRLEALGLGDVCGLVEHDGEPRSLVEAWVDRPRAVLVDVARTGGPPGTVRRWRGSQLGGLPPGAAGHAEVVSEALDLGLATDRLPRALQLVTIEGGDFRGGRGLMPEVHRAALEVADELADGLSEGPRR